MGFFVSFFFFSLSIRAFIIGRLYEASQYFWIIQSV